MMIRPRNKALFAASALAALTACGEKAVELPDRTQSADGSIGFVVREDKTRASEVTLAELTDIGVFGYSTGYERWDWMIGNNAAALKADYFCNTQLKRTESWRYSPLKYWPMEPAKRLSFFAYSPWSDGAGALVPYPGSDADTGAPLVYYTVPAGITAQVDLLWDTVQDKNIENPQVDFMMKHALAALTFSARFANETEAMKGYSADVTGISVSGVYGSGGLNLGTGTWKFDSSSAPNANYVLNSHLSGKRITTGSVVSVPCLNDNAGVLMLIPQDLEHGLLTFTINFVAVNTDDTSSVASFHLGDTFERWEAGKIYHYELLIRGDFITIDTSATTWMSGSDTTGNVIP